MGILQTNGFSRGASESSDGLLVCPTLARLNHSCSPNCQQSWDEQSGRADSLAPSFGQETDMVKTNLLWWTPSFVGLARSWAEVCRNPSHPVPVFFGQGFPFKLDRTKQDALFFSWKSAGHLWRKGSIESTRLEPIPRKTKGPLGVGLAE